MGYDQCGDRNNCIEGGIDASDRAWHEIFQPYETSAQDMLAIHTEARERRNALRKVGGCPVCVLKGRDGLLDHLMKSVCCNQHAREIKKWIIERRKPTQDGTVLCAAHARPARQAWILLESNTTTILPNGESLLIGHTAFAFRILPVPEALWHEDSKWVCGSSFGVGDVNGSSGGLYGPVEYRWAPEEHPLDFFKEDSYDYAKVIDLEQGYWVEALIAASDEYGKNYALLTNNCADVTRRVLTAFGCELPSLQNREIKSALHWWHECPGEIIDLKRMRRARKRPRKKRK